MNDGKQRVEVLPVAIQIFIQLPPITFYHSMPVQCEAGCRWKQSS